jgi:hypothetical protein
VDDERPVVDVCPQRSPSRLLRAQAGVRQHGHHGGSAGVQGAAHGLDGGRGERPDLGPRRTVDSAHEPLWVRRDPPGLERALQDAAEQRQRLAHRVRQRTGGEAVGLPAADDLRGELAQLVAAEPGPHVAVVQLRVEPLGAGDERRDVDGRPRPGPRSRRG